MNKILLKKLGLNIKFERKNKKLSQEKLAELIGKTRNYVGMIERAEINIPVSVLFDISRVLNIDIRVLFEPWFFRYKFHTSGIFKFNLSLLLF